MGLLVDASLSPDSGHGGDSGRGLEVAKPSVTKIEEAGSHYFCF